MPLNIVDNSIAHVELPSTDFKMSQAFYSTVFGWTCEEIPQMNYLLFRLEGGVGGGFNKVDKVVEKSGHMAYITVADINATLEEVKKAGGS
ncbi:MAG: VOC family protein, partial [bacterium]